MKTIEYIVTTVLYVAVLLTYTVHQSLVKILIAIYYLLCLRFFFVVSRLANQNYSFIDIMKDCQS